MSAMPGDEAFMAEAIALSLTHLGQTSTNPSVGCIIVRDGIVVGRGVTAVGGRPHAETEALAEAGEQARGATVYVTLEPCSHHGRTPPCANALIAAGVSRVVVSVIDPDERVSGRGLQILRDAGITVETGLLETEGRRALAGYLTRKIKHRAHVTLKLAVSSDGMIGRKGEGQVAITGPAARQQVHRMRAETDAILIGIGTALADDPELTVRLPGLEARSPVRIVLDRRLELPLTSKLVRTAREVPVVVVTDTSTQVKLLTQVPPSVLPDISPSRGEISVPMSLASTTTEMLVEAGSLSESISPLEGEMSGRTEGGIRAATPEVAGSNLSFEVSVGHGSISLHVGEMSGRTEGGIQAATPEEAGSNPSFEASVGHGSISPLVGEMSGRTEGGIHAATPNDAGPNLSFKASVGHGSISPLEGEMSGRTEGGMHTETLDNFSRRQAVLQSAGVEVLKASSLGEFLEALASRDISTLMVEGGASVAKAFLAAGLVDRIILFTGPGEIGAQGIASPVTGTNIPAGFTHYRSETYGPDRCDYFERDL